MMLVLIGLEVLSIVALLSVVFAVVLSPTCHPVARGFAAVALVAILTGTTAGVAAALV